jgi:ribosome biogenesis GTPase
MYALSTLGYDAFFENQLKTEDAVVARISAEHRGGYRVWSNTGAGFATLAGKLSRELEDEAFPGVGDWVVLKSPINAAQTAIIQSVLDRRTVFIRGASGREVRGQVVAANIDIVFIVCGLDNDYNVRRIERYLSRVFASGAQPVVVLNKADVCSDTPARTVEVESHCPGVDVVVASAVHHEGMERIRACISPGVTAAFVGSSGTGKSTIINVLSGEETMATGATRSRDGRGCHTTSHRQLIMLPRGGLLIDTPGMRELQMFDEEGIDSVFADIEVFSGRCRFRDCRHESEPGCAVKQAVEIGEISPERLEHYLQLQKEAQAYELRHNEHKRRKAERVWGQLYDEAARIRRWKHGE